MRTRKSALCTDPEWQGRADCVHCGVRHMMLFSALEDSDFAHLLKPVDNLRYCSGSGLYAEGQKGEFIYSIRSGYVKLEQLHVDGSTRIVRLLGRGAIVGFEAILEKRYRHTVEALSELDVCRVHHNTLRQLEEMRPELSQKLMEHWDQHLSYADRWISDISTGPVRDRVVSLCRYLQELNGGKDAPVHFFGYEDMAAMLGVSRETFSRAVAALKSEGMLIDTESSHTFIFRTD